MPIRVINAKVNVTRGGQGKVVPPNTPFNFTKEELDQVKSFDINLVRTPNETEARGAVDFESLGGTSKPSGARQATPASAPEPKAEPQAASDDAVYTDEQLEEKTIPELKEIAGSRQVEYPSNANKAVLKKLILEDQDKGDL